MLLRLLVAALSILPLAARAQAPAAPQDIPPIVRDYMAIRGLTTYDAATLPAKEIVAAAFGTEYGRALVTELAEILAVSADKACLHAKKLGPADFARRSAEIYDRHGTRIIEAFRAALNPAAYEAALSACAPSLHADVAQLRRDPDVQKLLALEEPTRFSGIADLVVENLAHYLLLRRIKLTTEVAGVARGNTSLSDRYVSEEALEARYQFVANSRSPQLKRYIGLLKMMMEARGASADQNALLRLGPVAYFSGVEADLAELCIPGVNTP
jgi:hypothetical protein